MASVEDKSEDSVDILKASLDEQRRFHDELTSAFRNERNKIVYFIGTILAILTFLYAGATDTTKTVAERLFIPDELYGLIFYFAGLFSLMYALVSLIRGARPDTQWNVPSDVIEESVLNKVDRTMTEQDFLQRLVDEYEQSTSMNLKVHTKKSEAIRTSFFPLLIGAIILIVLRFFQ